MTVDIGKHVSQLMKALGGKQPGAVWSKVLSTTMGIIDLRGASLSHRDLRGLSFSKCDLSGADLSHCLLVDVDMTESLLEGANLAKADLRGAKLKSVQACGAIFTDALLDRCDLTWADFRDVDFSGCDLARCKLWKTDLRGACFAAFQATDQQDYVGGGGNDTSGEVVPFSEMLRKVGAMLGVPYRWKGDGEPPEVPLPNISADIAQYLENILAEHELRATPMRNARGEVDYYVVLR